MYTPTDHRTASERGRRSWSLAAAPLVAALATLGLVGGACAKSDPNAGNQQAQGTPDGTVVRDNVLEKEQPPVKGGQLVVAVTGETNGWNPGMSQWADAGVVVGGSVLEPLMTFDPDGSYRPWLAESMEPTVAGDYKKWTIKLKSGIKFHNGEAFDAAAVKQNIDFYAHVSALSSLALGDYVGETVVKDPLTLEVNLNVQWASYPTTQANGTGFMLAPAMLNNLEEGNKHPIGTGPFVFDTYIADQYFKVKRNPDYWQKGLPYLDAIDFRPMPDSKARINGLQSGDIDVVMTNRAADVAATKGDYTIIKDWNTEKTYLLTNTVEDPTKKKNPFKNVHARRALAYATNREALIATISDGEDLKMSNSPIVEGTKFFVDEKELGYYPFDQAKAREEIELYKKDTGYPDFSFEFSGLANVDDRTIMQALQQQWKEVGIECEISTVEQQAYIIQLVSGAYQLGYFRNYAYPDPDANFYFWSSGTAKGLGLISINFNQYKSDVIDEALELGRSTPDVETRKKAYATITKEINDAAINTWLYNTPFSLITQPSVHGLNPARQQSFGDFLPKPWLLPYVWKQKA